MPEKSFSRRNLIRGGVLLGAGAAVAGAGSLAYANPRIQTPDIPDFNAPPEDYSAYEPQDTCDPTDKPGLEDFRDLTLDAFPETGDWGISRDCGSGTSEHYDGRAWDWEVYASSQREIADAMLDWLLAERDGEPHALLRRLGVMYIIWDSQILGAYRISEGWRPYSGDPHIDHVHFSFDRAGSMQDKTWWTARA